MACASPQLAGFVLPIQYSIWTLHPTISTAQVFSRDCPWKVAQWTGRRIRESWGVLWLVIHLLSVRADVSSSVRSILPCTEHLYCIPLYTCQHAGALPATTNTSPAPRRRTVTTKYYYCTSVNCSRSTSKEGTSDSEWYESWVAPVDQTVTVNFFFVIKHVL
jgi:hypothetical protein